VKIYFQLLFVILLLSSCSKDIEPEVIPNYNLEVSVTPSEGGTVTPTEGNYEDGTVISILGKPSSEYIFKEWNGGITGTTNPISVTMSSNKNITGVFEKRKYPLSITIEGEGTVEEELLSSKPTKDYPSGSVVKLTGVPIDGWEFVEWSGDVESTENPISVTVSSNKIVIGVFKKRKYTLSIIIEGEGTVTEEQLSSKSTTDYPSGNIVQLTGVPSEGWEFVEWTGDLTGIENPSNITIDGPKTVRVKFIKPINYFVNSHYYKNEMNPYFDLNEIVENHGLENPKYGGYDTGVAYADFNGDGYIDINLLLNPGQDGDFCEHFMLINNGDNTFSKDNTLITNLDFETYLSRKTIVGDFNGDKKPDVVRIAGGHDWLRKSNILISENDGYTFKELDVVPESQYHGFASGDLDNDGDLDLFFGSPNAGFAMNDGSGNFTWFRVDEKIDDFFSDAPEHGPYGMGTIEILDINKDGNEDIIIGGSYKDNDYDEGLNGPTILWGNGSSNYDYNNKTEIWGFGEKPMFNGSYVDNNDDFSFADIDNDGYLDVVLGYIKQIDNDPDNNGNTTMSYFYQVMKGNSYTNFTDVTDEWLPYNIKYCTVVWVILKDIDNNGQLDLTEYAKTTYKHGSLPTSTCSEEAWRWEWNGSSFTKIN